VEVNGEYGCLGDLGIHTQHIPFAPAGAPQRVRSLSKIVTSVPTARAAPRLPDLDNASFPARWT